MASLLKSLHVGSVVLKNRIIMPPMAIAKSVDGYVNQEILDYYSEKTKGGYISLVIIEHCYVRSEGKAHPGQLSIATDSTIEGLKKLADAIHKNGSLAIVQISHAGSGTKQEIIDRIPVAPSSISHPISGTTPQELTQKEISVIIRSFTDAARRAKAAGFDGVEIHSAHGYLLNQFFSPLTNKRTDSYGGDLNNRIRIHTEIIQSIRSTLGNDFLVLLRLGASDFDNNGITINDSQLASKKFEEEGINILDITGSFKGFAPPPGILRQGYFASLSKAIKQAVSIPVILTGGITDPHEAEKAIENDEADLIGVGRAILKDSLWAKHAVESLN